VRVGVVGNSYPLGHHCDLYESPNNYIGNASTVPFRHLSQHGDSLFCSYPARFALWLQQTFPGATLDVVSFAIGGFRCNPRPRPPPVPLLGSASESCADPNIRCQTCRATYTSTKHEC
jgi:hypothetical protein